MDAKHTPGPWEAGEYYITAGKDRRGAPITIACAPSGPGHDGFREADAVLLAAAPDLLGALENVRQLIITARVHFPKSIKNPDTFQLENTNAAVAAAIAQAKGKN